MQWHGRFYRVLYILLEPFHLKPTCLLIRIDEVVILSNPLQMLKAFYWMQTSNTLQLLPEAVKMINGVRPEIPRGLIYCLAANKQTCWVPTPRRFLETNCLRLC